MEEVYGIPHLRFCFLSPRFQLRFRHHQLDQSYYQDYAIPSYDLESGYQSTADGYHRQWTPLIPLAHRDREGYVVGRGRGPGNGEEA